MAPGAGRRGVTMSAARASTMQMMSARVTVFVWMMLIMKFAVPTIAPMTT